MIKLLNSIDIHLDRKRADKALKLLEKHVQSSGSPTTSGYAEELKSQIESFFNSIGRPLNDYGLIDGRSRPTAQAANRTFEAIAEDIEYLYDIYKQLSEATVKAYNHTIGTQKAILGEISDTSLKALDVSISQGLPQTSVFVAGDNFENSDFIESENIGKPYGLSAVTLPRTGTHRITSADVKVEYEDYGSNPPYEGLLYAPAGQARPAGAGFNFVKVLDKPDSGLDIGSTSAPVTKSDIKTVLHPPTAGALADIRSLMFDDQASSFWEIERVVRDDNTDTKGLTISLVLDLKNQQTVNWVVLDPVHFNARTYVEVLSLESSKDGVTWNNITNFSNSPNIITDSSNLSVTDDALSLTLEKSRFSYSGKGLWTFAPVETRYLRFKVRSSVPYRIPYEVVAFSQTKTIDVTKHGRRLFGLKVSKDKTNSTKESRIQELGYIESLASFVGDQPPQEFIEEAQATVDKTGRGNVAGFAAAATTGVLAPIAFVAWNLKRKTTIKDSGWVLDQVWNRQKDDILRYAIGVRELGIYRNTYSNYGELISTPFTSPIAVRSIKLLVDEVIPENFSRNTRWIEYYVSVDNGSTWVPIAPNSNSFEYDSRVNELVSVVKQDPLVKDPRITYIVSPNDVFNIKFKAVFKSNDQSSSPALKWYKLVLTTAGT